MKKFLFILFFFIVACCFYSCYDENNTYGESLVDTSFRNVSTDTSTVLLSSSLIDSLETSGKGVALAGKYTHSLWGTVSSTSYIPYSAPSFTSDADETLVFDSLVFVLKYNGYSIGDTTKYQYFSIHRIQEKVVLNDNGYLYNNASFAYAPESITSFRFRPKSSSEDNRIEVRLPDEMGKDLLTRLHNNDQSVSTDHFEDYFKGLAIVPSQGNCNALMAFAVDDTAAAIIIRYHVSSELNVSKECVIHPNTSNEFYHIDHDRTGTMLNGLPFKKVEVSSENLGNRGLIFGGIGWFTRLKFPYLNNILDQGKRVSIESASLKIYPEVGTYSDFNALPDSIFLYITDENNVVTDAVKDYLGTEVQGGTLVRDETFAEKTYYLFDITTFMQEELGTFGMYKHNLQLVFNESEYTKTLRNLTVSDQKGKSPIVLQLIYKVYGSY